MTLVILYWTTLTVCWLRAEHAGEREERFCVRAVLACSLLTKLVIRPAPERFLSFEWRVMLVDALLLAILVTLVVRSRKYWPIWATGIQVVDLATHLTVLSGTSRRAYALALGFWAYLILAAAMTGTLRRSRL